MNQEIEEIKLANARKRVEKIKGFYRHAFIYVVINIIIFLIQTRFFQNIETSNTFVFWGYLSTPIFWGIGLLIHALFTFLPQLKFVKKWEERKLNELLNKDD